MTLTAALVTSSWEIVTQARSRLRETRDLIALNRRRLNPWWGISGSSDGDGDGALMLSVRDRLERGDLAPVPGRVGACKGTGQTCAICKKTIYPAEIENEVTVQGGGETVRLWSHIRCLDIWRRASQV